jgi:hypothetical protein
MDKKTVPIADQVLPRRRAHIRTKYVTDALLAAGNFKTIHEKNR